ncbi:50S ribosomal protein L6 [Methanofollis aquaemaris]|uniref:Large ribosomal subunit protein uL6 n=1 Tax=Methanofollis aquaemaris TaxID=126734 RepID=A0A8A3S5Y0_9EURY|nr:50S ribosomal protein L6 [Methanofollis aquaemaris]QSZ67131.1 50S ribosomal protein L6 [Methanofollis aquaemaris]
MTTEKRVAVPDGVTVSIEGFTISVNGPKGEISRDMRYPGVSIVLEDSEVVVSTESTRKRIVAMIGTYASHIRNMVEGVTKGFEYQMKVVYAHFPIQIKLQGDLLSINNFLGEKQPRVAKVLPGVTVKIGNDELTITGIDKERVGATAAKIERATKVRKRDTRVFQDGIYIVQRA